MKIFSSQGRADRSEYFLHVIAGSFVFVCLIEFANWILSDAQTPAWVRVLITVVYFVTLFALLVDEVGVTVRRLRDLGRPRSHLWLLWIPLYNIYLSLVLLLRRGIPDSEPVDESSPAPSTSPEKPAPVGEYVCSRCGADIEWGAPTCPSCGDTIEY
jgi:uncharacterized membrane protein YhaH (DUF805 family)